MIDDEMPDNYCHLTTPSGCYLITRLNVNSQDMPSDLFPDQVKKRNGDEISDY